MTTLDLGGLVEGILPFGTAHRLVAMLFGYFDESGTDGLLEHTTISGFVGDIATWGSLDVPWREELKRAGVPCFHYVDARGRNKNYRHFKKDEWKQHVDILGNIIWKRDLKAVCCAFSGDWDKCVDGNEEWQARFPSAYHFCFELVIEKLKAVSELYGGEPIVVIMSRQEQYEERATKVWDFFNFNRAWTHIAHVGYNFPDRLTQLQAADAIAYETRRGLWIGKDEHWLNDLPVTSRLLAKHDALGGVLFDNGYNEKLLKELMERPQGPTLTIPPKYRKNGPS